MSTFINSIAALAALLIAGILAGLSPAQLGLGRSRVLPQLGLGALLGLVACCATIAALAALGAVRQHPYAGSVTHQPLAAVAAFFVLVSISEELLFRGILFGLGRRAIGAWPAAVLSSAAFALVHAQHPATTSRSIAVTMLAGLILAALVQLTSALWAAIAFHLAWNVALGIGAGLPVSGLDVGAGVLALAGTDDATIGGGAYGPEGGTAALGVLLALAILLGATLLLRSRSAAALRPVLPHPRGTLPCDLS